MKENNKKYNDYNEYETIINKVLMIGKYIQEIKLKFRKGNQSIARKCELYNSNQLKSIVTQMGYPCISKFDTPYYDERKKWDSFWLLSPLIGKKSFREGKDDFLFAITKIKNKRPIFTTLFAPQKKELFFAINNKAYKLKNVNSSLNIEIEDLLTENNQISKPIEGFFFTIMKNKNRMNAKTENFLDDFKLHKRGTIQEKIDESPMNLIGIAEGKYDFYPHLKSINEWDIAPFDALITASGNRITQKDGILPLEYNSKRLKFPAFIAKNNFDIDSINLNE